MHTLIILGGNRESRQLGALIRIVATILLFPLWVMMIIECGKSSHEKIEQKYNVNIISTTDSLVSENAVIRTDSSIIEHTIYANESIKFNTEYIPRDINDLEKTLNSLQKRLEKDMSKRIKRENRRK